LLAQKNAAHFVDKTALKFGVVDFGVESAMNISMLPSLTWRIAMTFDELFLFWKELDLNESVHMEEVYEIFFKQEEYLEEF
jgi:hypothetical protein